MIYIITHKKTIIPKLKNYIPLQVGAALYEDLGYLKDNNGSNISYKNPSYCELTGLYWIWKNTVDEYKGIVHYRRYFGKSDFKKDYKYLYTYEELLECLGDNDIVLPYIENFKQNAKDEILIHCCTIEIFNRLEKVIETRHPEYTKDFEHYFSNNKSTLFNMMFCHRDLFDAYCEWLFDILFTLEKYVDISLLNNYQKRLYGFLSERLLNIWVNHNDLKKVNVKIVNTESSMKEKFTIFRRRVTNEIAFSMNKWL